MASLNHCMNASIPNHPPLMLQKLLRKPLVELEHMCYNGGVLTTMARPLLPPRGVHVPARMIYHPQLPPALILTWIKLRGLAWGGTVTPPLRMQELAALTAKHAATPLSDPDKNAVALLTSEPIPRRILIECY